MEIKLIKDGGQYHITIGEADAWLDTYSAMRLGVMLHETLADDLTVGLWPTITIVKVLRYVAEEYGGKTIENIIQQMEARVNENETSKKNPQSL